MWLPELREHEDSNGNNIKKHKSSESITSLEVHEVDVDSDDCKMEDISKSTVHTRRIHVEEVVAVKRLTIMPQNSKVMAANIKQQI